MLRTKQSSKALLSLVSDQDQARIAAVAKEAPPGVAPVSGATLLPPRPLLREKQSSKALLTLLSREEQARINDVINSPPPAPSAEPSFVKRSVRSKTDAVLQLESGFFGESPAPAGPPRPLLRNKQSSKALLSDLAPSERSHVANVAVAVAAEAGPPRPLLKNKQSSKSLLSLVAVEDQDRVIAAALAPPTGVIRHAGAPAPTEVAPPRPLLKTKQSSKALLTLVAPEDTARLDWAAQQPPVAAPCVPVAPAPAPAPTITAPPGPGKLAKQSTGSLFAGMSQSDQERLLRVMAETDPDKDSATATSAPRDTVFCKRSLRSKTDAVLALERGFFAPEPASPTRPPRFGEVRAPPRPLLSQKQSSKSLLDLVSVADRARINVVASETAASCEPVVTTQDPGFAKRSVRQKTAEVASLESGFFSEVPASAPTGGVLAQMAQFAAQTSSPPSSETDSAPPRPFLKQRQSSRSLMDALSLEELKRIKAVMDECSGAETAPASPPPEGFVKKTLRSKTEAVLELEAGFFSATGSLARHPLLKQRQSSKNLMHNVNAEDRVRLDSVANQTAPPMSVAIATARDPLFAKRSLRSKTEAVLDLEKTFFAVSQPQASGQKSTPAPFGQARRLKDEAGPPRPLIKNRQSSRSLMDVLTQQEKSHLRTVGIECFGATTETQFRKRRLRAKTEAVLELEKGFFDSMSLGPDSSDVPRPFLKQRQPSTKLIDALPLDEQRRLQKVMDECFPADKDTLSTPNRRRTVRCMTETVAELDRSFFRRGCLGPRRLLKQRESSRHLLGLLPSAEREYLLAAFTAEFGGSFSSSEDDGARSEPEFVKRTLRQRTEDVELLDEGFFSSKEAAAREAARLLLRRQPSRSLLENMEHMDRAKLEQVMTECFGAGSPRPTRKRVVRAKTETVAELESGFFNQELVTEALLKQRSSSRSLLQMVTLDQRDRLLQQFADEEGEDPQFRKRSLRSKTEEVMQLEKGFFSDLALDAFEHDDFRRTSESVSPGTPQSPYSAWAEPKSPTFHCAPPAGTAQLDAAFGLTQEGGGSSGSFSPSFLRIKVPEPSVGRAHQPCSPGETPSPVSGQSPHSPYPAESPRGAWAPGSATPTVNKTTGHVKRVRRDGIKAERVVMDDKAPPVVFDKSKEATNTIVVALRKHFLFAQCQEDEVMMLANAMDSVTVTPGYKVMEQGDLGDYFYVIETGEYNIVIGDGIIVDVAKPGECFGELALMFGHPRSATIIAKTSGVLWRLGRNQFRSSIHRASELQSSSLLHILQKVPLLSSLRDYQRMRVAESLEMMTYEAGTVIQTAGEIGSHLYIITKGKVNLTASNGTLLHTLQEGDFFGERSLLLDEPLEHAATAVNEVELHAVDRPSFDRLMGPLRDLLAWTQDLRLLESVPILQKLTEKQRDAVIRAFTHVDYTHGQYIIHQGEKGDAFYIVKSGSVVVSRSVMADGPCEKFILAKTVGDYFGEMALVDDGPRAGNVVASGKCTVARLSREDFERLLGPLRNILERETQQLREAIKGGRSARVTLSDLKVLRVLGTGAFGKVQLTSWRGKMYALKCLKKSEVIKLHQQEHVKNELAILSSMSHPLIMRLEASFKDDDFVYMMCELIQGGELFRRLSMVDALENDTARFYTANCVSFLQYLSDHDIVYRDLKPENLLIDEEGYLKLVDFGCAKIVTTRTYTLCGSPEYVAPEVFLGKGYNQGVDIWALGVLVYELAVGFSPFNPSQDLGHLQVCSNIIQGKLTFPRSFDNDECKDFIQSLLVSDPIHRLGMQAGGWEDIKTHAWFSGFDWAAMEAKTMRAPWIPPLKDAHDMSCFDEVDEFDDPHAGDGTACPPDDCPGWDDHF
mmetsp:Transcript_19634/g.45906  ORF Transcript_19634/g.45906 Transcript_19634/m.45906 type:complete len:1846 (+) Transcript_19634:2-5539(+)